MVRESDDDDDRRTRVGVESRDVIVFKHGSHRSDIIGMTVHDP